MDWIIIAGIIARLAFVVSVTLLTLRVVAKWAARRRLRQTQEILEALHVRRFRTVDEILEKIKQARGLPNTAKLNGMSRAAVKAILKCLDGKDFVASHTYQGNQGEANDYKRTEEGTAYLKSLDRSV